MAETSGQERTEQATPRKVQKARQEGQIARSNELSSVAVLVAAAFAFWAFGETTLNLLGVFMRTVWARAFEIEASQVASRNGALAGFGYLGLIVGPYMLVLALTGVAINVAQVGFALSPKALKPKLEKLNVFKGLKRLVSRRSGMELIKSVGKISILAALGYWTLSERLVDLPPLAQSGLSAFLQLAWELAATLFVRVIIALLLLACLDYAFQRWQTAQDLKMTKQEVKDEMKETDGDSQVRGRIRRLQQEMSRRRMMKAVPEADVVVTNPTHYAVALKYKGANSPAPLVVAKGADLLAKRIREIASAAGVPIVEDKPTAQALYNLTEVGDFIPQELFGAVAEILALVYRRRRAAGS